MSRKEFSCETKEAAWERSGERCEASGPLYGLPVGQRCGADLNLGVEYDHIDPDANSKDNSLANCCAACPRCHRFKTAQRDIPRLAKTKRQMNMRKNTRPKGRGFRKMPPDHRWNWNTGRPERIA